NEGTVLSSAMTNWNGSRQSAYAQLAQLTQARQFSQVRHHGKTLAVQRGIVVLATKKFLVLRSSNGSLHLWLLSGKTKFQNVSNTMAGTRAMTASTSTAQQAMRSGNMIPATSLLPDHGRGPAAADSGRADRHRAGGQHQPHRDDHREQEHGDREPDRDHAAGRYAGLEPGHVHPERLAGHARARPRRPGAGRRHA